MGNGYADLVAIEPSGRLVVAEIKLSRNAEARRAVVAQVLTYAAHLKGLSPETVERDVLGRHLRERGYEILQEAVASNDQEGSFDYATFSEGLAECLGQGHFRLVLVLDEAPQELVTLVGYLESVTDELVIDLITVSTYEVGSSQVLVPQRVDAERPTSETSPSKPPPTGPEGHLVEGADDFADAIEQSPQEHRPGLRRLCELAVSLEREGLVHLSTYHGVAHRWTLLPRLRTEKAGLVTIWHEGGASLQFWRSVFERRAPRVSPVSRRSPRFASGKGTAPVRSAMSYSRRSPTPTGRRPPESSAGNSKRTDENSTRPLTSRRRTYYSDRFVGRKERGGDVLRLLGCRRPREVRQMEGPQPTKVRDQPQVTARHDDPSSVVWSSGIRLGRARQFDAYDEDLFIGQARARRLGSR